MEVCPANSCTSCNGMPRSTRCVIRLTRNRCGCNLVIPDRTPTSWIMLRIPAALRALPLFLDSNRAFIDKSRLVRYSSRYIADLSVNMEIRSLPPLPCKSTVCSLKSISDNCTPATSETRAPVSYMKDMIALSRVDLQFIMAFSIWPEVRAGSLVTWNLICLIRRAGDFSMYPANSAQE